MTTSLIEAPRSPTRSLPGSYQEWHSRVIQRRVLPVIGIAGSRGKSTVVRLLDSIFTASGLRSATWTSAGVEIRGRRQFGELAPWSRALSRLAEGTLDVAIQELDWSTVHAVGLPTAVYPVLAVTNICVNNDVCLVQDETKRAVRALASVIGAVEPDGSLVLNAEDYAVSGTEVEHPAQVTLVAQSRDTPLLRAHLAMGGFGAWSERDELRAGLLTQPVPLCRVGDLAFALHGRASFEVHNALTAATVALLCGVSAATVAKALETFVVPAALLPGSFNVVRAGGFTAVVDRAAPSWFLRPILRAVSPRDNGRTVTVLGRMDQVSDQDLPEVGRLVGRSSDVLILHSQEAGAPRAALLRQGAALNDVPPVVVHVPTERRAVTRAIKVLRPGDTALFLADDPASVLRALQRVADIPD